jgi:hypothetical protein
MADADLPRAGRLSARMAIGFAVFLAVAEIVRNWGDWGYWPFWVVDYIAVALLAIGALRTLRAGAVSPWLAGGWGFTCAMFYMSFFSHVAELRADANAADHGPIDHWRLTITIGVLFAITIAGFALSLRQGPHSPRPTDGP